MIPLVVVGLQSGEDCCWTTPQTPDPPSAEAPGVGGPPVAPLSLFPVGDIYYTCELCPMPTHVRLEFVTECFDAF